MTISPPIQYARGAGLASLITVTLGAQPALGNVLVAVIGSRDVAVSTVTQNNVAWSKQKENVYSDCHVEIWLGVVGANASPIISVTLPGTVFTDGTVIDVCEFSGVAANGLDQTASNGATSGTLDTGTTPPTTQADELWIGGITLSGGYDMPGATNGFTLIDGVAFTWVRVGYFWKIVNTIGSANTGTANWSNDWSGCIATFKASVPTNTHNVTFQSSPELNVRIDVTDTGQSVITPQTIPIAEGYHTIQAEAEVTR